MKFKRRFSEHIKKYCKILTRYQIRFYRSIPIEAVHKPANVRVIWYYIYASCLKSGQLISFDRVKIQLPLLENIV